MRRPMSCDEPLPSVGRRMSFAKTIEQVRLGFKTSCDEPLPLVGRRMSFAKTIQQVRFGFKTQTRRDGWRHAQVGWQLVAVEKAQGLRRGETQRIIRSDLVITSVQRQPLGDMTEDDVAAEGFPGWTVGQFCELYGRGPGHVVTVLGLAYLRPWLSLENLAAAADEEIARLDALNRGVEYDRAEIELNEAEAAVHTFYADRLRGIVRGFL